MIHKNTISSFPSGKRHSIIALSIFSALQISHPALAQQSADTNESPAASEQQSQKSVERIQVTSRALNLYRNGESDSGKLSVDPLNSTQMISSINENLIKDQGARDAKDLYRNIAGVSLFSYAGVTARGFRQEEIYFDGLRGDPYVGFNVPQLFNVEQLDFLKGPAGMLYGAGAPGGIFNYVTKKPKTETQANARLILGTDNRFGGSVEATGETFKNQSARVGLFYEEQDGFRDNTASEVTIVDLGYRFEFEKAMLTTQYTHYAQDLDGNRLRGVPTDDNGEFYTDVSWNHNEASDFLDLRSDVFQLSLEGAITSNLSYDAKVRFIDNEQTQQYHEPRVLLDTNMDDIPDLVLREFRDQIREEQSTSVGINFEYQSTVFGAQQRTAFGIEHFDGDFDGYFGTYRPYSNNDDIAAIVARYLAGESLATDIVPLRLNDPDYGLTDSDSYLPSYRDSSSTQKRQGAYVLNELAWQQFTLVAGIRTDKFEDGSGGNQFDDTEQTFRLGAIYKPAENISIYTQWADSYQPQSIGNQAPEVGGSFQPVTGEIIELGINAELFDESTLFRAAVYQIKRQNILQSTGLDPEGDGRDNFAAIGEVTSDGLEIEVLSDLTENWVLSLAYAYNDAVISEDNGNGGFSNSVGDQFANAPRNTFGFWTRYQITQYNLALAFGGDYVDDRLSLSGQTVKSYFIADASIIYEVDDYSVLLRVDNLFDKEYAESGFLARTGHFPGETRSAFVEVSYKF